MICSKCHLNKNIEEFSFRNRLKNIRHKQCRICHDLYAKTHYKNNREKYIDRAKKNNRKYKEIIRQVVVNYLKSHPCIDCGENDIVVLDFDHRSKKNFNIAGVCNRSIVSVKRLLKEIEKCDVRCSNCHRRRHARERNFWKK